MIFVKSKVLLTWELIFQLELSSHASKTDVFVLKEQGFRLPVFVTFFHYFLRLPRILDCLDTKLFCVFFECNFEFV